jgi:hypothetical protein
MRAGVTERRNRLEYHSGGALWAKAIGANDLLIEPVLSNETRTKETV